MTVLSRAILGNGEYRKLLALPDHLSLSDAEIEASLKATFDARPDGAIWIFGYGSLMWNPTVEFECREVATLLGWHRSFCLRSISARGSASRPGRMVSLETGGLTQGVAFRLREDDVASELRLLWAREMPSGSYCPLWVPVQLASGPTVMAIAFVANPEHPSHDADASVETVARSVAVAVGVVGSNAEYVQAIEQTLAGLNIHDPYVSAIAQAVKALSADKSTPRDSPSPDSS
jgi:glutathione-specific gamma-glutamylcyclotransferase